VDPHPRLLLIGPPPPGFDPDRLAAHVDPVAADPAEVARRLHDDRYTAVVAAPGVVADLLDRFGRDELVIGHIDKGLAVLDPSGTVTWANGVFRRCCAGDPVGKPLLAALGAARVVGPGDPHTLAPADPHTLVETPDPLAPARTGRPTALRLARPGNPDQPYLEVDVRPVAGPDGSVSRLVALVRNVTPEVVQQQKLDALHAVGRELAGLDPDQLSVMNPAERVELLKQNLRRSIHDLLHYDTIEVRLLDRKTGELKPLIEDRMTAEAAGRTLYARPTGNGVTGYVAFTGTGYLCPDTASDPLYIRGAEGARSSMTVPLKFNDEVIGTLNVESPRPNEFTQGDLQFTELFSREVAAALHTLDLLSAQQECTAAQSIEAVNREIVLPIDEVLGSASVLLAKADTDSEAAAHLRRILDAARLVKERVTKVGRDMTPAGPEGEAAPLAGKWVLVVDSDERMRRQVHQLLARLGARVETATTAAEGLAMAAENPYDAIFLDVKPPDMGGSECYRRFRQARPGATVALTTGFAYDGSHAIVKARQDGLKYVLFKPFRPDQVTRAVLDDAPTRSEVAGTT
jgi:CheY-like chemotaxis protein/GAF domain-containing protein